MTNQITDPPNEYVFGTEFNYAQWSANSTITLTNVPWSNTYRDVVSFQSKNVLNTYIDSLTSQSVVLNNMTLIKPNQPIVIDLPFNVAQNFNYLRASNPVMPVSGDVKKDYYYFVLGAEYLAPNATRLLIELDVWQTFFDNVSFDECFIDRGHIGVANSKQMVAYGKQYLTEPEGLDTGSEYVPVHATRLDIFDGNNFDYLITSTISLTDHPGTVAEPKINSAKGGGVAPFILATETYVVKYADLEAYLTQMSQYPWITQGIIEVRLIPSLTSLGVSYSAVGRTNNYPPGSDATKSYLHLAGALNTVNGVLEAKNFRDTLKNKLPARYQHLNKFLTAPYSMLTVTTHDANHVHYKPELFHSSHADFSLKGTLMPGNAVLALTPWNYNDHHGTTLITNERRQYACVYDMFPSIPVLNNGALLSMANTARSRAQEYVSAEWGNERNVRSLDTSYDNQTATINAQIEQGALSRSVDAQQTELNNRYSLGGAVTNIGGGAAIGAATAGPAGAIGGVALGAINTGMSLARANEELNLRQNASIASQNISTGLSGSIRNNNHNLGTWAARGDYQNQVAALNAKTQDMQMTPPSVSGQMGGDFLKIMEGRAFNLIFKSLSVGDIARIGEYWLRYGYAVRRFAKPPTDLHCMSRFTYWKMLETYLSGNIPEYYKNVIRGIFEKGVTVWRQPTYIGKTDLGVNQPLTGIEY